MNIKRSSNPTSCQTGTRPALYELDKACDGTFFTSTPLIPNRQQCLETEDLKITEKFLISICFDLVLLLHYQFWLVQKFASDYSALDVFVVWVLGKILLVLLNTKRGSCVKVAGKVRSLPWTTALSIPHLRSQKAQLASLLLLFCTLTIATRCYASTNSANGQIDRTLSPIPNSKAHSSNLVLSRLTNQHFVQKRLKREVSRTSSSNLIPGYPRGRKRRVGSVEEVQDLEGGSFYRNPSGQGADIRVGENLSDVVSVTGNFSRVVSEKLNYSIPGVRRTDEQLFQGEDRRLMPPADGQQKNSSLYKWEVVASIIVSSVALTVTFGLITCILSQYRAGAAAEDGGTAASDPNNAALTPTSAPMLSVVSAGATAGVGGMERLRGGRTAARDLAAAREQQVRLHALRTDLAVNLPPSIAMPDGEDHPYSNARIHIRDAEQEAEIYQKCIRPPPNRTVLESESPPPYRSSSAGLLGSTSSSSSSADWTMSNASNAPLVERCHSMSSTTRRPDATSNQKTDLLQRTVKIFTGKRTASSQAPSPAPTLPAVVVPSRRRPPEQNRPTKGGV